MNEKPFFEVFRTLQVDGQLHSLFEQVMVTRVSTNPGRDVLRVYIVSKKLIAKDQLFHIAKQIQRQGFGTRKSISLKNSSCQSSTRRRNYGTSMRTVCSQNWKLTAPTKEAL